MNQQLLGLALAAGMVAALNPCGFAMLPAYLTLVVDNGTSQASAVARALAATAVMALGFLTVFGVFGLLTVSVASTVQQYLPYVTLIVGAALVGLGCWLLSGRELTFSRAARAGGRWAPTTRLGSMFGYGIGYAVASLSCTAGPFLAVTGSSLRSGPLNGLLAYAAYAAGITLVVGVLAVGVSLAGSTLVGRMRGVLPYVNRVSGAITLVVGCYVGYYGWFELRLRTAEGGVDDPVIAVAGRVQRAIAGWVYQSGAWPWALALAVLTVAAAWAARRRNRRAPANDPQHVPAP